MNEEEIKQVVQFAKGNEYEIIIPEGNEEIKVAIINFEHKNVYFE